MIKNTISILMALVLVCVCVSAATVSGKAGDQVQITKEGDLVVGQAEQTRADSSSELRDMTQERAQEMEQEMAGIGKDEKKVLQNQNRVRLAVHSLLAMEDLVGGVGRKVSEIAREFDNSVQATIRAENRVAQRGGLARFFAGGDHESAGEIEEQVKSNKVRIETLKRLRNECECSSSVKSMFQEQINSLEQEQVRLGKLAKDEKDSKGLFGWIWKS